MCFERKCVCRLRPPGRFFDLGSFLCYKIRRGSGDANIRVHLGETKIMELATCPACRSALPKKPSKKTKCASCGEFIFVRDGRLMTAKEIEQKRIARIRVNDIHYLGFSEEQFRAKAKTITEAAGHRPAFVDVIIVLVEERASGLLAQEDSTAKFISLRAIYTSASDILKREERDTRPMKRLGHLYEAKLLRKIGFKRLAFRAPDGSCEQCAALSGKTYSPDEMVSFLEGLQGDDPGLCCCYIDEANQQ